MTRPDAIKHLKAAFMRGDITTATRLLIENRISYTAYKKLHKQYYKAHEISLN